MTQLIMGSDDGALAVLVKLRTTGTAENLHDIQDTQIHQGTALGVVDLSSLLEKPETKADSDDLKHTKINAEQQQEPNIW